MAQDERHLPAALRPSCTVHVWASMSVRSGCDGQHFMRLEPLCLCNAGSLDVIVFFTLFCMCNASKGTNEVGHRCPAELRDCTCSSSFTVGPLKRSDVPHVMTPLILDSKLLLSRIDSHHGLSNIT